MTCLRLTPGVEYQALPELETLDTVFDGFDAIMQTAGLLLPTCNPLFGLALFGLEGTISMPDASANSLFLLAALKDNRYHEWSKVRPKRCKASSWPLPGVKQGSNKHIRGRLPVLVTPWTWKLSVLLASSHRQCCTDSNLAIASLTKSRNGVLMGWTVKNHQ